MKRVTAALLILVFILSFASCLPFRLAFVPRESSQPTADASSEPSEAQTDVPTEPAVSPTPDSTGCIVVFLIPLFYSRVFCSRLPQERRR